MFGRRSDATLVRGLSTMRAFMPFVSPRRNESLVYYTMEIDPDPALAFIEAMGPRLATISPHFRALAKKSGGSLMRVYRDTRFSKDKTPYKTNVGIQFRHEAGRDVHCPGFYLHLEPGRCFLGAGIWRPDSKALRAIRDFIADNPGGWRKAVGDRRFGARFMLDGESLVRAPRGYPPDHPLIEDLKRKDFIATADFADAKALERDFVDWVASAFQTTSQIGRAHV